MLLGRLMLLNEADSKNKKVKDEPITKDGTSANSDKPKDESNKGNDTDAKASSIDKENDVEGDALFSSIDKDAESELSSKETKDNNEGEQQKPDEDSKTNTDADPNGEEDTNGSDDTIGDDSDIDSTGEDTPEDTSDDVLPDEKPAPMVADKTKEKNLALLEDMWELYKYFDTIYNKLNNLTSFDRSTSKYLIYCSDTLKKTKKSLGDYIKMRYNKNSYEANMYSYYHFCVTRDLIQQIIEKVSEIKDKI